MKVAALEPRELFQLSGDKVIFGEDEGLKHVGDDNWNPANLHKGNLTKTLIDPTKEASTQPGNVTEEVKRLFKLGDKGILLHLFGGAAGAPTMAGMFAGHFAFGLAEVVTDPLTGEDKFDVEYKQIYAHNVGGIVSGASKWRRRTFLSKTIEKLRVIPGVFGDNLSILLGEQ